MKRILQVSGSLGMGGLETVAMNCMRYADRTKYQFDFLVFGDSVGEYEEEAIACGCNVIHIPAPGKDYLAYYRNLCDVIKRGSYDIVHSHVFFNSGLVMYAAAKQNVKTRIAHAHSVKRQGASRLDKRFFYAVMQKLLIRYSTEFCACSSRAGEYVFTAKAFVQKGTVLPNSIDVDRFLYSDEERKRIRQELGIDEHATVIGQVGHLTAAKNQRFLIDLFAQYKEKNDNAVLLLVGDGELRTALENQIDRLGLKHSVKLAGTRQDVASMLSAMDIYVCTSTNEGFGITLLEAGANGLPVVIEQRTLINELKDILTYRSVNGFTQYDMWISSIEESRKQARDYMLSDSIKRSCYATDSFANAVGKLYSQEE